MPEMGRGEADIRKEMPLYIVRFYGPVSRMKNSPLKTGRFETRFNCSKQHTSEIFEQFRKVQLRKTA
jgi:hypothetical protein